MFIVASLWKLHPGNTEVAKAKGQSVRRTLVKVPGIAFVTSFQTEQPDEVMVFVGYADAATYNRIINDPDGPFAKAIAAEGLEDTMTWVQSWRGESMDN